MTQPVHSNTDSMLVLNKHSRWTIEFEREIKWADPSAKTFIVQLCTLCSMITVKFFCKPIWKNTIRAIVHQLSIIATGGNTNKFLKEVKFNLLLCWKLLSSLIFYSLCCICYESSIFLHSDHFLMVDNIVEWKIARTRYTTFQCITLFQKFFDPLDVISIVKCSFVLFFLLDNMIKTSK